MGCAIMLNTEMIIRRSGGDMSSPISNKLLTIVPDVIVYALVYFIFGWQLTLAFFLGVTFKGLLTRYVAR